MANLEKFGDSLKSFKLEDFLNFLSDEYPARTKLFNNAWTQTQDCQGEYRVITALQHIRRTVKAYLSLGGSAKKGLTEVDNSIVDILNDYAKAFDLDSHNANIHGNQSSEEA